jgi:hypothetical protein
MWSVNMIDELRDIKGVALWMTGSAPSRIRTSRYRARTTIGPKPTSSKATFYAGWGIDEAIVFCIPSEK